MPEKLSSSAPEEIKKETQDLKSPEQQDIKEREQKLETFGNFVDKIKALSEHGYEKGNKTLYYRANKYQIFLSQRDGSTLNDLKMQYSPVTKTMTAETTIGKKIVHIGAEEGFDKLRTFTESEKANAFLDQFPAEKKETTETADVLKFVTILNQAQELKKFGYDKGQKLGAVQLDDNRVTIYKRNSDKGFDQPTQIQYSNIEEKLLAQKIDPETKKRVALDIKDATKTMGDFFINENTEKYLVEKKEQARQQKEQTQKLEMGYRRKFVEVAKKAEEVGVKKIKTEDGAVIKFGRNGSNEISIFPSKEFKQQTDKDLFYIRILGDKMLFVDKSENQSKQSMKDYGKQIASIEETLNKHIEDENLEKNLNSLN